AALRSRASRPADARRCCAHARGGRRPRRVAAGISRVTPRSRGGVARGLSRDGTTNAAPSYGDKCNHENTKATKEYEEESIFFVCFFVLSCLRGPGGKPSTGIWHPPDTVPAP